MGRNTGGTEVAIMLQLPVVRQNSLERLGMIEFDFLDLGEILCLFQLKCYKKPSKTLCRVSL